jgi:ankyrin repeat protein
MSLIQGIRDGLPLESLIINSYTVNFKDQRGSTALHLASWKNRPDVLKIILGIEGIDINVKNNNGHTSFYLAVWKGHTKCMDALMKHRCDVYSARKMNWTTINVAICEGQHRALKLLLVRGYNLGIRTWSPIVATPLMWAKKEKQKKCVRVIKFFLHQRWDQFFASV